MHTSYPCAWSTYLNHLTLREQPCHFLRSSTLFQFYPSSRTCTTHVVTFFKVLRKPKFPELQASSFSIMFVTLLSLARTEFGTAFAKPPRLRYDRDNFVFRDRGSNSRPNPTSQVTIIGIRSHAHKSTVLAFSFGFGELLQAWFQSFERECWGWLIHRDFRGPPLIYVDIDMSKLAGISLSAVYFKWHDILSVPDSFSQVTKRPIGEVHRSPR